MTSYSTSEGLSTQLADDATESAVTSNLVDVIETVIESLDHDNTAMVNHSDSGYVWKFKYGTVEVFIQLTGLTDDDTFTVWSSVLQLPAKNEPQLFRKLLEMNWTNTLEARFAVLEQAVIVVSSRSLQDLSPSEISRTITIVATIADEQDEPLQSEFSSK